MRVNGLLVTMETTERGPKNNLVNRKQAVYIVISQNYSQIRNFRLST